MKSIRLLLPFCFLITIVGCQGLAQNDKNKPSINENIDSKEEQMTEPGMTTINKNTNKELNAMVELTTEYGTIKIKLYDETPLHRDNFLKLTKEGFYNDLLFHRVIKQFMIQGGDPNSKNAAPGQQLGNGGPGYTIPAEIKPQFFHKKGVLSAARQGDQVNPEKKSSGSQFYIVQGKKYSKEELKGMEQQLNMRKKQMYVNSYIMLPENKALLDSVKLYQQQQNREKLQELSIQISKLADETFVPFKFSEEQIEAYSTVGGTPHLDGDYTVFGEVVEGLDIIDKIAAVKTLPGDRPEKDVKFSIKTIE